jgi:hypothetical protein
MGNLIAPKQHDQQGGSQQCTAPTPKHLQPIHAACYMVAFKFTEIKLRGYRNEIFLLQHHGNASKSVMFNKSFVGGSWWQTTDEDLHMSYHHNGDARYEVYARYTRIAGTDSWSRHDNDSVFLSRHTRDQ